MEEADYFEANDNVGWLNPEDIPVPEDMPAPILWRVLVIPVQPKKVSSGGIMLPTQAQDAEGHLQFVGKVASLGPLAYTKFQFATGFSDWVRIVSGRRVSGSPKVGDWVVYGRYAGQRCEYKGIRLIMLNDDELLCRTSGPEGFRIHV